MFQPLRALAALSEQLGSVPSTHVVTLSLTLVPGAPMPSFGLDRH